MIVMDYQTRDGLTYYGFSIDFESARGWRVYIIFQPSSHGNDDSLKLPYQARDDTGRRYVDWSEKIDNLADAKTVAALWAEVTQRYQRTQEKHALYVKLIEHYQHTRDQRRVIPVASEESLCDSQEGESKTQTVADAGLVVGAGATIATTLENRAARNTLPVDPSTRNHKSGARHRHAAGALHHRRSNRNARRHR
jgi:hypothetical protein